MDTKLIERPGKIHPLLMIAFSALHCVIVVPVVVSIFMNLRGPIPEPKTLARDIILFGTVLFVPSLIFGVLGGAALWILRHLLTTLSKVIVSGGTIGFAFGLFFMGLAQLFDPTTVSATPGNGPLWLAYVLSGTIGIVVGASFGLVSRRIFAV